MRLLKISKSLLSSGFTDQLVTIDFVNVPDNKIKDYPYAILSHRWNDVEVSFQDVDVTTNSHLFMPAWMKIQKFCEVAFRDGWNYAWADTCSYENLILAKLKGNAGIDKSNNVELSRELNSMFRYYEHSAICYTYMADVSGVPDVRDLDSDFSRSVWFKRGWTLQELLASGKISFRNKDWEEIGSKASLAPLIRHITNIRDLYNWKDCCIAEKLSWWGDRETEETEDVAYSLLGIFGVTLVPIYGEGERAFQRLQLAIMEKSNDESIFAWRDDDSMAETGQGLLATSPMQFKDSGNVRPVPYTAKEDKLSKKAPRDKRQRSPYVMTQNGMQLEAPWLEKKINSKDPIRIFYKKGVVLIPIRCTTDDSLDKNWIGIMARNLNGSNYKKLGIRLLEKKEQNRFLSSHVPYWSKTLLGAAIHYRSDVGAFGRTTGYMGSSALDHGWPRFYFKQNDDEPSAEVLIPRYRQKGIRSLMDAEAL